MRLALWGLVLAAVVFIVSGGHVLFLPLLFVLPLGGLLAHRRRHRTMVVDRTSCVSCARKPTSAGSRSSDRKRMVEKS